MRAFIVSCGIWSLCLVLSGCAQGGGGAEEANVVAFTRSFTSTRQRVDLMDEPREPRRLLDVLAGPLSSYDKEASAALGLSREGFASFVLLKHCSLFATSTQVGREQRFPLEIHAFQRLLQEKHAGRAFERLLSEGGSAGQLYGLCGLYFTRPARFAAALDEFRTTGSKVFTMQGQGGYYIPTRTIVDATLAGGAMDDTVPSPSSDDVIPNSGATPPDFQGVTSAGRSLDIVGGGYPRFLRDATLAPGPARGAHSAEAEKPPPGALRASL